MVGCDSRAGKFEARIAEEDSYVITLEDGYLVRSSAEPRGGR
jgi:hypothetical protein